MRNQNENSGFSGSRNILRGKNEVKISKYSLEFQKLRRKNQSFSILMNIEEKCNKLRLVVFYSINCILLSIFFYIL